MNKKIISFAFGLAFFLSIRMQAQISPGIFGQNADLTDWVGETQFSGHLDSYWAGSTNYILESKTKFMRYGGNLVEANCKIDGLTTDVNSNISKTIIDYITKAEAMQDDGITPMMTLPLKFVGDITSFSTAATHAGALVNGVNTQLKLDGYNAVLYWIYSNEPNLDGGPHPYQGTNGASLIHDYIVSYNTAVLAIWNTTSWGTVKFVGPELTGYDNFTHTCTGCGLTRLIEQLTGHYNQVTLDEYPNGAYNAFDIRSYVNIFTWHYYPFNDESTPHAYAPDPTTPNVIKYLTTPVLTYNSTTDYTRALKTDIDNVKAFIGSTWLATAGNGLAITEANICYKNDVANTYGANGTDDLLTGNGANSFIAGQFWAEMMGICMQEGVQVLNFWSSIGGTDQDQTEPHWITDVGFLNSKPGRFGIGLGGKKPTYYHYKTLAENFAGRTFLGNTYANSNVDFKAFAYKNTSTNELGVIIMNQTVQQNPRGTDISTKSFIINRSVSTASKDMEFTFASTAISDYECTITNETTLLLVFNSNGTLATKQVYNLGDALRTTDTGPETWGLTSATPIVAQADFESYYDAVYSDLLIQPNYLNILEGSTDIKTFRFSNSATVGGGSGDFTVPLGAECTFLPSSTCP